MLKNILGLVGQSRVEKLACQLLLQLKPLPDYLKYFDRTNSGDIDAAMAVLREIPELEDLLRLLPGNPLAGALFSIKNGHTLELRTRVAGTEGQGGTGVGVPQNLSVTRLGEDLWGWFVEPVTAEPMTSPALRNPPHLGRRPPGGGA